MDFICNICGNEVRDCPAENVDRDISSCPHCRSTVRFRSVVHVLSEALFGRSMPLPQLLPEVPVSVAGAWVPNEPGSDQDSAAPDYRDGRDEPGHDGTGAATSFAPDY